MYCLRARPFLPSGDCFLCAGRARHTRLRTSAAPFTATAFCRYLLPAFLLYPAGRRLTSPAAHCRCITRLHRFRSGAIPAELPTTAPHLHLPLPATTCPRPRLGDRAFRRCFARAVLLHSILYHSCASAAVCRSISLVVNIRRTPVLPSYYALPHNNRIMHYNTSGP